MGRPSPGHAETATLPHVNTNVCVRFSTKDNGTKPKGFLIGVFLSSLSVVGSALRVAVEGY
jgi:hypothetical protein